MGSSFGGRYRPGRCEGSEEWSIVGLLPIVGSGAKRGGGLRAVGFERWEISGGLLREVRWPAARTRDAGHGMAWQVSCE